MVRAPRAERDGVRVRWRWRGAGGLQAGPPQEVGSGAGWGEAEETPGTPCGGAGQCHLEASGAPFSCWMWRQDCQRVPVGVCEQPTRREGDVWRQPPGPQRPLTHRTTSQPGCSVCNAPWELLSVPPSSSRPLALLHALSVSIPAAHQMPGHVPLRAFVQTVPSVQAGSSAPSSGSPPEPA